MNLKNVPELTILAVESRTIRALTETLQALSDTNRACGADGLYLVVSGSDNEYFVDLPSDRYTCPDTQYNLDPRRAVQTLVGGNHLRGTSLCRRT